MHAAETSGWAHTGRVLNAHTCDVVAHVCDVSPRTFSLLVNDKTCSVNSARCIRTNHVLQWTMHHWRLAHRMRMDLSLSMDAASPLAARHPAQRGARIKQLHLERYMLFT